MTTRHLYHLSAVEGGNSTAVVGADKDFKIVGYGITSGDEAKWVMVTPELEPKPKPPSQTFACSFSVHAHTNSCAYLQALAVPTEQTLVHAHRLRTTVHAMTITSLGG